MARKLPPVETRFKKGQSGNPSGRPKVDPKIQELRSMTKESFKKLAELIITADREQLKEIAMNPKATAIELWIAKAAVKGIERGDWHMLDSLLNRLIGKVKEEFEVTVKKGDELAEKLAGDRRKNQPEHQ